MLDKLLEFKFSKDDRWSHQFDHTLKMICRALRIAQTSISLKQWKKDTLTTQTKKKAKS